MSTPLLMIPGPIEVSPAVKAAYSVPPPGHLSPPVMNAMSSALGRMRAVWRSAQDSQPFVLAGSGTAAMDMAVQNLVEKDDRVVVVSTGYFSERMAAMLRRVGAQVDVVAAAPGDAPSLADVEAALQRAGRPKALFVTHVDTSTGVRTDAEGLARLARKHGALSVFDGVCATAGERFEMQDWDADVYLTASQKAIGLPPGLALMVASARALETREARRSPVASMSLDWKEWQPILRAYEEKKPAYFATPATNLVLALDAGLGEILAEPSFEGAAAGVASRIARNAAAARKLREGFRRLGLAPVPVRPELEANTLSALRYPAGVDASLVGRVIAKGVVVAGGLHPAIKDQYFRVGHMGYSATQPEHLDRALKAIEDALGARQ
jgi:alanine-glyoxylate transaminase/serine-glyoxylate transaminase/serine-pyruvate transaminase